MKNNSPVVICLSLLFSLALFFSSLFVFSGLAVNHLVFPKENYIKLDYESMSNYELLWKAGEFVSSRKVYEYITPVAFPEDLFFDGKPLMFRTIEAGHTFYGGDKFLNDNSSRMRYNLTVGILRNVKDFYKSTGSIYQPLDLPYDFTDYIVVKEPVLRHHTNPPTLFSNDYTRKISERVLEKISIGSVHYLQITMSKWVISSYRCNRFNELFDVDETIIVDDINDLDGLNSDKEVFCAGIGSKNDIEYKVLYALPPIGEPE